MGDNILEFVREDDFVEYFLYPLINKSDHNKEEHDLKSVEEEAKRIIQKYINNYLWHKDPFQLRVRTGVHNKLISLENKETLPPHLYGVTHYGDNIEDEWFIVFLLIQLTKEIEGLIVQVQDADGEFILIEAAESLPTWANPETCEGRVFLANGFVHIIAPEDTEEPSPISIPEALKEIRNNPALTVASSEIQTAISSKLKGFPGSIKDNQHRTTAFLPMGVAALLNHKPNLIAPAVLAFCNRDTVDMKACKAMKYFPPENRVLSSVTFTKCLYAMLTHSKYVPDRKTGWNLPGMNSPQFKSHLLGVKIACGFEILISQAKPSADIESDKGWQRYLKKLQSDNYFKGLLEHSKEYNELLNTAKEYYTNHRDSMQYSPEVGKEILDLTKTLEYSTETLRKMGENLPTDDDESWLNISPEELDKMLQEKYGQRKLFSVNSKTNPSDFSSKVTEFLEHISDINGAEYPHTLDNSSPVRPPRGIKNKGKVSFASDTKNVEKPSTKINFDPNNFSCAVQNILNFVIPEDDSWNLDTDSDMSDYANEDENVVDTEELKNKMKQYMDEMDKELASTTVGESFVVKSNGDKFDDIEDFKPVDIDMNALKNILESYKAQMGEAGPSSNMLGPMGIHMDPSNDDAS